MNWHKYWRIMYQRVGTCFRPKVGQRHSDRSRVTTPEEHLDLNCHGGLRMQRRGRKVPSVPVVPHVMGIQRALHSQTGSCIRGYLGTGSSHVELGVRLATPTSLAYLHIHQSSSHLSILWIPQMPVLKASQDLELEQAEEAEGKCKTSKQTSKQIDQTRLHTTQNQWKPSTICCTPFS